MKNTPEKLFLVIGDVESEDVKDFDELEHEFVCWSQTRTDKSDIEYIRKNKLNLITRQLHETQKEVLRLRGCYLQWLQLRCYLQW